ncbi:MAG TPA: hypothetical protein VK638_28620 [Edaphobacter sp.]|nr:hypothetical protein [Edaphobacter sp.]
MKNRLQFQLITTLVSLASLVVQICLMVGITHRRKQMEKLRDEFTALTLKNAKELDATQLKLDQMKAVCGIARGVKRN